MAFINTAILVLFAVGCRYLCPGFFHTVIWEGILLHIGYVAVAFVAVAVLVGALLVMDENRSLGVVYILGALFVLFAGSEALSVYAHIRTYRDYPFADRPALVATDPKTVRFTPPDIAHQQMVQKLQDAQFTLEQDLTNPATVDGHFGYAVPITPDGVVAVFTQSVKGIMVYDDGPTVPDGQEVRQVVAPGGWKLGEEMRIADNLQLSLYRRDPCCTYEVYYAELQPGYFVAVATRTKYRMTGLLTFVPYWDGVTLVHPDGKMEWLSVEQALSDVRLDRVRLYPFALSRQRVEVQRYAHGLFSQFYRWPGKIKIPDLPGDNPMPFLIDGADQKPYWTVTAESDGGSSGLYAIYYIDAHSGEGTAYRCPGNMVGPERALDLIQSAPDYKNVNWAVKDKEGSVSDLALQAIESVYLTRGGRLYWKVTITNGRRSRVTSTAVMDAERTGTVVGFDSRSDFQRWLEGGEVAEAKEAKTEATPSPPSAVNQQQLEELRGLLRRAQAIADGLGKK